MATHLRLFPESVESTSREESQEPAIHVSLGDLLPLLALARRFDAYLPQQRWQRGPTITRPLSLQPGPSWQVRLQKPVKICYKRHQAFDRIAPEIVKGQAPLMT